jgi:membrane protease subunit HflC
MKRVPWPTIVTGVLLCAALVIYSITFQVRFDQVAVKVRMGKADASSVVREPGVYLKWPPPFETVETYDRRLRVLDTPETEIPTRDGSQIVVAAYALWRVADPLQFYVRAKRESLAEEMLRSRVSAVRATVLGQRRLSDLVNLDAEHVNRSHAEIEKQMLAELAPGFLSEFGIELVRVGIRRVSLPAETTRKVFESMSQEREQLATRYRQEGTAGAEAIKARANEAKDSILAFARRRAEEIRSEGVQSASRILEQIESKDRDFFIWLRGIDALRSALKERSTIFLDSNSELFKYFTPPTATPPPAAAEPE